jgi:hypothetical protein
LINNSQQSALLGGLGPEFYTTSTHPFWLLSGPLLHSTVIYRPSLGAIRYLSPVSHQPFRYSRTSSNMATTSVPRTPRASSLTAPDITSDNHSGRITRSITRTKQSRVTSSEVTDQSASGSEGSNSRVARTRRKNMGLNATNMPNPQSNGDVNGFLKVPVNPAQRELSRSPSPLGLIPIHLQFRSFVRSSRA